jgi:hypothetical protein
MRWAVIVHTKSSCPVTDARRELSNESGHSWQTGCESWNRAVNQAILADHRITDVFVSTFSSAYSWTSVPGDPLAKPATDGFQSVWRRWVAAGKSVHVLADVPRTAGNPIPTCLFEHRVQPQLCALPRREAVTDDVAVDAARAMHNDAVSVVDLTAEFCDATTCYARIGNVIVYRDRSHLSVEYSRLLAPYVIAQL